LAHQTYKGRIQVLAKTARMKKKFRTKGAYKKMIGDIK